MPGVVTGTPVKFEFADAGSGKVLDFGSAPAVDQFDCLGVNSNTTVSTPSGFTLAESKVTNQGAYWFARKASGGEASTVTLTTSGNHPTSVHWIRLAACSAIDTSTSTEVNSSIGGSTPAHNTGALAEDDELVLVLAALHSIGAANQSAPVWSDGYTALLSSLQGSSTTGVIGYSAYKTGAGTAAETPSVSWSGAGAFNRYILVLSFTTLDAITATAGVTLPGVTAAGSVNVGAAAAAEGGSWETLLSISREARQLVDEERRRPLVACPLCGEPLESARGVLHCPFDGSVY